MYMYKMTKNVREEKIIRCVGNNNINNIIRRRGGELTIKV